MTTPAILRSADALTMLELRRESQLSRPDSRTIRKMDDELPGRLSFLRQALDEVEADNLELLERFQRVGAAWRRLASVSSLDTEPLADVATVLLETLPDLDVDDENLPPLDPDATRRSPRISPRWSS